jgi:uncharacterized protein YbbC (DUF1343 family)
VAVISGLEQLCQDPALVCGRRMAVLANQAAVTTTLEPAWRALASTGATIVRLLAPEHGLWGVAQDMESVGVDQERGSGLPVHSLYGSAATTLAPPAELLADVDAVVVDLQDIGCRYYTFAATMAHTMAACERAGVEVVVCDRPNPIGGVALEGGGVEAGFRSFVSELPVPVRHGMTLGELALLLRAERNPRLALAVVPCKNWKRSQWWDVTGLAWVAPSPNMATLTTATIYAGACLLEATNLSEGRGTTRPFQLFGAPWLDGEALAAALNRLALPGCGFRPTRFRPEFHKHAGEVCEGCEWHVTDRLALRPLEVGIEILRAARQQDLARFAWRTQPYEFVTDVPAIDLLTGSERARAVIEGDAGIASLRPDWDAYCQEFAERRRQFLLYG